ncbi:hypothetical protein JTE90_018932 [Oedothorax gibbosus]|uniref:Uncharacterized protein n=1 Tax=Oedothorax gibbosus TaxID=931172 RepID=A0AAV6VU15_9ARAC|nr:hypothetical protein JTE90_018932 [Oedothorax gibbosus]
MPKRPTFLPISNINRPLQHPATQSASEMQGNAERLDRWTEDSGSFNRRLLVRSRALGQLNFPDRTESLEDEQRNLTDEEQSPSVSPNEFDEQDARISRDRQVKTPKCSVHFILVGAPEQEAMMPRGFAVSANEDNDGFRVTIVIESCDPLWATGWSLPEEEGDSYRFNTFIWDTELRLFPSIRELISDPNVSHHPQISRWHKVVSNFALQSAEAGSKRPGLARIGGCFVGLQMTEMQVRMAFEEEDAPLCRLRITDLRSPHWQPDLENPRRIGELLRQISDYRARILQNRNLVRIGAVLRGLADQTPVRSWPQVVIRSFQELLRRLAD